MKATSDAAVWYHCLDAVIGSYGTILWQTEWSLSWRQPSFWSKKMELFWIILSSASAARTITVYNSTAIALLRQDGMEEDHLPLDQSLYDRDFICARCGLLQQMRILIYCTLHYLRYKYCYSNLIGYHTSYTPEPASLRSRPFLRK